MASFKVPCPSCEHQVPIKSESDIGTKVECPKCKYRFKVEAPAGGVTKDAGKPDKKKSADKAAGKKKSKKMVPIIVGVLAVAILAAVGFAFMGGDKKPQTKGGGNVGGGNSGGTPVGGTPDGPGETPPEDNGKEKPKPTPPKSNIPLSAKEASNLLPAQTVSLCRVDVEKLRQNTPVGVLFDPGMLEMFQNSIGVNANQVAVYYHAYVGAARDPFGVIRLSQPVLEKDVVARMSPASPAKPIKKKWNLYQFKSNPFVNGVSNAMAFGSLFGELYDELPVSPNEKPTSTPETARTVGLCVYDSQHILVGDYAQLEKFLATLSDKGDPRFQSDTTAAPGVTLTDTRFYLSIDPKLKQAMRELGGESQTPPLVVLAEQYRQGSYDPKRLKSDFQPVAVVLDPILNRTEFLGASITSFTERQLVATVRLVMKTDAAAFEVVKDPLTPSLTIGAQFLSLFLHTPVEFRNQTSLGGGTGTPMPGTGGTTIGEGGDVVSGGGRPMGMGFQPPTVGSGGGPPRIGPNYGQPGSTGSPRPGMVDPLGPGGMYPGMGTPSQATTPESDQVLPSRIDLKLVDQNITIHIELNWNSEIFRHKIEPRLMGVANTLKGKVAVYASDTSFHALSAAVVKMTQATKEFPPGTAPRALSDASRHGLKYDPKTRVSFYAKLLPYISTRGDELEKLLGKDQAWFDDGKNLKPAGLNNLLVAEEWVPELLVSTYPQTAWRATSPLVATGRVLGGTNYVGIAGVGLDAARYDPKNPNHAKKLGIAGYEWGSTLDEIADKPENTIYLMQTPPGGAPQPWLAGGGATLRGLNETDPMQAFRHTYGTPDGKPGTFALMGNGDVRFIPGDIDPKLLLAMATRAGGEDIASRLDKEAPIVLSTRKKEPEPKIDPKTETAPSGPPEPAPPPRAKG